MTDTQTTPAARTWSQYQIAVFDAMVNGAGNVVVEAVAGSGKTTTLLEGVRRYQAKNPGHRILFAAFNKAIADELASKVPARVDAKTLHSVCFGAVRRNLKNVKVDDRKLTDLIRPIADAAGSDLPTRRDIASDLAMVYGRLKGMMVDVHDLQACEEVCGLNNIDLKCGPLSLPLLAALDKSMRADTSRVSFDEMLTFVTDFNMATPKYDLVMIDESQDLNLLQIELCKRLLAKGGRFIAVGDTRQAIYAFRGADSEAMDRIRREFNVPQENRLPLSITYRCPAAVVAEAIGIVPHLRARENAPKGTVINADAGKTNATLMSLQAHDMVVCAINAPLVSYCLKMIRAGRRATVRGRDIGRSVIMLAEKMSKACRSTEMAEILEQLARYRAIEVPKLIASDRAKQADALEDRCDTLIALADGLSQLNELQGRADELFSDGNGGVLFSSIHRSKGLEAHTVVFLGRELCGFFEAKAMERGDHAGAMQIQNLQYVAITRAIDTLIYLSMNQEKEG